MLVILRNSVRVSADFLNNPKGVRNFVLPIAERERAAKEEANRKAEEEEAKRKSAEEEAKRKEKEKAIAAELLKQFRQRLAEHKKEAKELNILPHVPVEGVAQQDTKGSAPSRAPERF